MHFQLYHTNNQTSKVKTGYSYAVEDVKVTVCRVEAQLWHDGLGPSLSVYAPLRVCNRRPGSPAAVAAVGERALQSLGMANRDNTVKRRSWGVGGRFLVLLQPICGLWFYLTTVRGGIRSGIHT